MKPKQMQVFLSVARQGSIRAAARELDMSQPALTKALRELERTLGVSLFDRTTRGVNPTTYGRALEPRARLLLADMDRVHEEIAQIKTGQGGHVTIALSTSVALTMLPTVFKEFRSIAPLVRTSIGEGVLSELLAGVRDGSLDFAVAHTTGDDVGTDLDVERLFPAQLFVGVRNGHPLRRSRSLKSLLDEEWLLPASAAQMGGLLQNAFEANGLPPPERITEGLSVSVALTLIAATDLVGFFASPLSGVCRTNGIAQVPVREDLPGLHVCIIRRAGAVPTPVAELMLRCFRRQRRL